MKVSRNNYKNRAKKPQQQNSKWYNAECTNLKSRLKNQAKLMAANPRDPYIRGQYNKVKKLYRKTVKMAKRQHETTMIATLQEKASNPKEFWAFLKKINKGNSVDLSNCNAPGPNEWLHHFSSLNALDPSAVKTAIEHVNNVIEEVESVSNAPETPPSPLMAKI